jgi:hypothetical protein
MTDQIEYQVQRYSQEYGRWMSADFREETKTRARIKVHKLQRENEDLELRIVKVVTRFDVVETFKSIAAIKEGR